VVASEAAPATTDSASASADSADLTVTGDDAEPVVTEETLEMPVAQDGASTEEEAELTAAEGPSETGEGADMEEPMADAANAPVAPGIIPANITPKANTDTATVSTDKRAAEQREKTPQKTRRAQRAIRKDPRPWKVIPYDQPVKQPSRLDSNQASPRNDRWGAPGSSGFNQK
jgi:hypothetical protein